MIIEEQGHESHAAAVAVGSIQRGFRSNATDESLVSEVCSGNRSALEELYDRHIQQCFGLSFRMLENDNAAEEVVHCVFTDFWVKPHTYSPGRGAFSVWLLNAVCERSVQVLVQSGLRAPSQVQRQIIALIMVEGLNCDQITERLNRSPGTLAQETRLGVRWLAESRTGRS